jgi:ribosome-associated protein
MPNQTKATAATETALQTTEDYARFSAEFLSDRLGSDILLLDVTGICSYADYFVIATGETDRHLDAMAGDLIREVRKRGLHAGHSEGEGRGGWVLIDFPGFIVHLFSRPQRDYYALEKLWARGTEVVRLQ